MNDQDTTAKVLEALRHPVRREILMRAPEIDWPMSPRDLAEKLDMSLSNVSYHARVLADCDLLRLVDTQQRRGALQHFYEPSDVMDHPVVRAALDLRGDGG